MDRPGWSTPTRDSPWSLNMAAQHACWCLIFTSGRAPSGCGVCAWSSRITRASGSRWAIIITEIHGKKNAIGATKLADRRSMMEMKLDGNAAGGVLQVTLPFDMTLVQATCAGCGATNALGAIVAYMHGMGTVVRCQSCDTVLIRIAQARGHYFMDMPGIRVLEIGAE